MKCILADIAQFLHKSVPRESGLSFIDALDPFCDVQLLWWINPWLTNPRRIKPFGRLGELAPARPIIINFVIRIFALMTSLHVLHI